jgi:hypothetical protein
MDCDRNLRAVTGQSFVDGVVDNLEDHVVQTAAVVGVSDVHPRPFADSVEALQNFDFA